MVNWISINPIMRQGPTCWTAMETRKPAKQALLKAVELSDNQAERAFLQAKIADL